MKVRLSQSRSIDVDLQTKEGYDELVKELNPFIEYYSRKIFLEGEDRSDIKQRLFLEALRRIHKYDSEKGTIFTFLQKHFFNMTTNWIIRERKEKNTAADYKTTGREKIVPFSLDADYEGVCLHDRIGKGDFVNEVLFKKDLDKAFTKLSCNEKEALSGILNQQTKKEIADKLKKSPSRINVMLRNLSKKRIMQEVLGKV